MMSWRMTMKPYFRIAVFDLDGTLLDTSEGILASVKYTIKKHGLPELSDDVLTLDQIKKIAKQIVSKQQNNPKSFF